MGIYAPIPLGQKATINCLEVRRNAPETLSSTTLTAKLKRLWPIIPPNVAILTQKDKSNLEYMDLRAKESMDSRAVAAVFQRQPQS